MQLGADADDAQQDISLFLVGSIHEAGQIEGKRFHERIEQLLAAAPAGGVGDGQAGVLALALHDHPVGQGDFEMRRSKGTIPLGCIRAETVAAQRPRQCVQHTGLALIVVAAHKGQPGGRRCERHRLDAFDVFGFQSRDLYRHFVTSP